MPGISLEKGHAVTRGFAVLTARCAKLEYRAVFGPMQTVGTPCKRTQPTRVTRRVVVHKILVIVLPDPDISSTVHITAPWTVAVMQDDAVIHSLESFVGGGAIIWVIGCPHGHPFTTNE